MQASRFRFVADALTAVRVLIGLMLIIGVAFMPVSVVLPLFLFGLITDAIDGFFARRWPYSTIEEKRFFWRKYPEILDSLADGALFYAAFFWLSFNYPECWWAFIVSISIGLSSLVFDKIKYKKLVTVLKSAYLYFYLTQVAVLVVVFTVLADWPEIIFGAYLLTAIFLLIFKRNRTRPWADSPDNNKGVKLMSILFAILSVIIVLALAHRMAGKPVEIQKTFSKTSATDSEEVGPNILYIFISGTGICNADAFDTIRKEAIGYSADVMYLKYPEAWLSFGKSCEAVADILRYECMTERRDEIRVVAASLGAKILIGAESRLSSLELWHTKITNYLIMPSFSAGDVRLFSNPIQSIKGASKEITDDANMDTAMQKYVNEDAASHKLLFVSQLFASFCYVNRPIDESIRTVIYGSKEDWLTKTESAGAHFNHRISEHVRVVWINAQTHCEFLRESEVYIKALKPEFSK